MPRLYRAPQQVAVDSAVFFPEFEKRAPRPDRFAQNVGMADTLTKLATGPLGEAAVSLGKNVKWGLSDMAQQYRDQKAAEARGGAAGAEFFDTGQEQSPYIGRDTTREKVSTDPLSPQGLAEEKLWRPIGNARGAGWTADKQNYTPYQEALARRTQLRQELGADPFAMPVGPHPAAVATETTAPQGPRPFGLSFTDKEPDPLLQFQKRSPLPALRTPFSDMRLDRTDAPAEDSVSKDVRFLNRMADVIPNVPRWYGSTPPTAEEQLQPASGQPQPAPAGEAMTGANLALSKGAQGAVSVATRPKTLGTATDEQLQQARAKLAAIAAANGTDDVAKQRLALVDQELGYRTYQREREPEPLTEAQWIERAKLAQTPQEQSALLAQIDNVRTPYANVMGMIGTGEHDRLLKLAEGAFPAAPRKSPEEIAAGLGFIEARADEKRAAAEKARADAAWRIGKTPAEIAELESRARLADAGAGLKEAQTEGEPNRRALLDAQARAANVKADDMEAMRAANLDKVRADIARLNAMAAKAKRISAGGGKPSVNDLKEAKANIDIAKGIVTTAKTEARDALDDVQRRENAAELARLRAQSVPDAGDPPEAVAENAPTDIKVQYAKALTAWRANAAARKAAVDEAKRQEGAVDRARALHKEALDAEREAMDAAKPWQSRAAVLGDRYAKNRGIVQPTPEEPSMLERAGKFLQSLPTPIAAPPPAAPSGTPPAKIVY